MALRPDLAIGLPFSQNSGELQVLTLLLIHATS